MDLRECKEVEMGKGDGDVGGFERVTIRRKWVLTEKKPSLFKRVWS